MLHVHMVLYIIMEYYYGSSCCTARRSPDESHRGTLFHMGGNLGGVVRIERAVSCGSNESQNAPAFPDELCATEADTRQRAARAMAALREEGARYGDETMMSSSSSFSGS